jgi:hypothetical protein
VEPDVLALCRRIAGELGAEAVVLVGSHARGTATAESDVDLVALGTGAGYQLSRREGRLVSLSWRTASEQRAHLRSPRSALTEVPGWRSAVIITDPAGIAAGLQRTAADWSWAQVAGPARAWVAAELTGYAEEVHKLVSALRSGRLRLAAAQRSVLALHLPFVLAVHFETLLSSENDAWDVIARRGGERWRAAQDRALGLAGESLADSCRGALEMYVLAAGIAGERLDDRERGVVAQAVAAARRCSRRR